MWAGQIFLRFFKLARKIVGRPSIWPPIFGPPLPLQFWFSTLSEGGLNFFNVGRPNFSEIFQFFKLARKNCGQAIYLAFYFRPPSGSTILVFNFAKAKLSTCGQIYDVLILRDGSMQEAQKQNGTMINYELQTISHKLCKTTPLITYIILLHGSV